jgi:hypothetical protein
VGRVARRGARTQARARLGAPCRSAGVRTSTRCSTERGTASPSTHRASRRRCRGRPSSS